MASKKVGNVSSNGLVNTFDFKTFTGIINK